MRKLLQLNIHLFIQTIFQQDNKKKKCYFQTIELIFTIFFNAVLLSTSLNHLMTFSVDKKIREKKKINYCKLNEMMTKNIRRTNKIKIVHVV